MIPFNFSLGSQLGTPFGLFGGGNTNDNPPNSSELADLSASSSSLSASDTVEQEDKDKDSFLGPNFNRVGLRNTNIGYKHPLGKDSWRETPQPVNDYPVALNLQGSSEVNHINSTSNPSITNNHKKPESQPLHISTSMEYSPSILHNSSSVDSLAEELDEMVQITPPHFDLDPHERDFKSLLLESSTTFGSGSGTISAKSPSISQDSSPLHPARNKELVGKVKSHEDIEIKESNIHDKSTDAHVPSFGKLPFYRKKSEQSLNDGHGLTSPSLLQNNVNKKWINTESEHETSTIEPPKIHKSTESLENETAMKKKFQIQQDLHSQSSDYPIQSLSTIAPLETTSGNHSYISKSELSRHLDSLNAIQRSLDNLLINSNEYDLSIEKVLMKVESAKSKSKIKYRNRHRHGHDHNHNHNHNHNDNDRKVNNFKKLQKFRNSNMLSDFGINQQDIITQSEYTLQGNVNRSNSALVSHFPQMVDHISSPSNSLTNVNSNPNSSTTFGPGSRSMHTNSFSLVDKVIFNPNPDINDSVPKPDKTNTLNYNTHSKRQTYNPPRKMPNENQNKTQSFVSFSTPLKNKTTINKKGNINGEFFPLYGISAPNSVMSSPALAAYSHNVNIHDQHMNLEGRDLNDNGNLKLDNERVRLKAPKSTRFLSGKNSRRQTISTTSPSHLEILHNNNSSISFITDVYENREDDNSSENELSRITEKTEISPQRERKFKSHARSCTDIISNTNYNYSQRVQFQKTKLLSNLNDLKYRNNSKPNNMTTIASDKSINNINNILSAQFKFLDAETSIINREFEMGYNEEMKGRLEDMYDCFERLIKEF